MVAGGICIYLSPHEPARAGSASFHAAFLNEDPCGSESEPLPPPRPGYLSLYSFEKNLPIKPSILINYCKVVSDHILLQDALDIRIPVVFY